MAVLVVALVAAGCGGGEPPVDPAAGATPPVGTNPDGTTVATDPATGLPIDPAAAGAATGDPGATEDIPGANELSKADATAGMLVKVSAKTPKKFAKAHCSKPILVVLYQPGSILDDDLYKSAQQGMKDAGVKDLVTLAFTPAEIKIMGDLPSKLGLLTTPGVATVGRDGTIENFWTTYVDPKLVARSVSNAANSKPCKVSNEEVPAAGTALADATAVANGGTVTSTDPLTGTAPTTAPVDAASTGIPADPAAAGAAPVNTAPVV